VLSIINDNLDVLEQRSGIDSRRLVELMIDTGRRPDELCQLPWTCLERDGDDKPVLIYTDSKNHRPGAGQTWWAPRGSNPEPAD
jgi:hypothetical protein